MIRGDLNAFRWLYVLFLMVDANFRARCKDRGFDDIELAPGWGYYVEEDKYQAHLRNCKNQPEVNMLLILAVSTS